MKVVCPMSTPTVALPPLPLYLLSNSITVFIAKKETPVGRQGFRREMNISQIKRSCPVNLSLLFSTWMNGLFTQVGVHMHLSHLVSPTLGGLVLWTPKKWKQLRPSMCLPKILYKKQEYGDQMTTHCEACVPHASLLILFSSAACNSVKTGQFLNANNFRVYELFK